MYTLAISPIACPYIAPPLSSAFPKSFVQILFVCMQNLTNFHNIHTIYTMKTEEQKEIPSLGADLNVQ